MKRLMRKTLVATGLAALAMTAAQATLVTVALPSLTFDDLVTAQNPSFTFDANHQPYSDILKVPPPPFGVVLTSTSSSGPTASVLAQSPPSIGTGPATLAFFDNLTFTVSQPGDTIASIQFLMLSGLSSVIDSGGAVQQVFNCGNVDLWCDSQLVSLRAGSAAVTLSLVGSGTLIDDVRITIVHETSGGGTVPEPASAALALLALTGAVASQRRRSAPKGA